MIFKLKHFIKTDLFIYFTLIFAALVSRLPFMEKFQSSMDGPQYSIAVVRYSFEQQTPGPPGYPLYIGLGKFFNLFTHDPYSALLLTGVLGSVLGAVILFHIGLKLFHRNVGIAAAAIFLTGSTFYYLGLTEYGYILIVPTTVLLAYEVYRIFILHKKEGIFLGLIFGICIGIRPQEILQIVTLFALGFIFLPGKEKIKTIISFSLVTLLWLVPIINAVGIKQFLDMFNQSSALIAYRGTLTANSFNVIKGFLLSFGISGIFLVYFLRFIKKRPHLVKNTKKQVVFFSAWIIPGLLINIILFSDHPGYQISYLTGILILLSYAIWKKTEKNNFLFIFIIIIISLFNLFWFFYNRDPNLSKPYRFLSFHYSEIVKNDIKLGGKIKFIHENFDPKTTLIVTNSLYWRPYMYYLKDYRVSDIEAIDTNIPMYMYVKRDAINWNRKEYVSKDLFLQIPQNIKNIVFTEDNAKNYIKNYSINVRSLPGNSTITSISVPKNSEMFYKYHFVEIRTQ